MFSKANESLSNSCNKFIILDKLESVTEKNTSNEKNKVNSKQKTKTNEVENDNKIIENEVEIPSLEKLKIKIKKYILETNHYNNGWAYYNEVIILLENEYPQFNYKIYGASGKKKFFEENVGCKMKTSKTTCLISMD